MIDADKGIQGFKRSEFAAATPEKVFGTNEVSMEDLPGGVRLYLREKAVDLGTKKVLVNVYRLVDDGGTKIKRVWVGRMKANRKPEDEEIAEQFGGGSYVWILKWNAPDGQECGIISEPIEIDMETGRAAHEAYRRRQGAESAPAAMPAAAPAPAAQASGFSGDAAALLKIMDAAEERTLARMERIAAMFQGRQGDTPAEILKSAYQGASDMMQAAVKTNLDMAKSVSKARELIPAPAAPAPEPEPEPEGPSLPAWLEPFMPQIEKGLEKLLGGGPAASAVKTLILSSDEWREMFNDPEKWGQFVSAAEMNFGSDRTRRALDILLNRRDGKQGKGKGK